MSTPQPRAALPEIVLARTVVSSDDSTSTVLSGAVEPQVTTSVVDVAAHTDVVYATREGTDGRDLQLRLDLMVPKTPGAKPLVVYLPGGGFVLSTKEAALARRTYVAEAGYAVASVQYRTVANGATYRDAVADAKSAVRFLRAHGAQYGLDTSKVAIWGESAGGYLASADNVVPPSQSLLLHTALLEQGVESTRYVLTGAKHGDLSAMFGDPAAALGWSTEEILNHITDFLAKHLRS